MPHGKLQGKRIIFIVTINFIDGCTGNPCRSVGAAAAHGVAYMADAELEILAIARQRMQMLT